MTILWKALALRDLRNIHAHIARYAGPVQGYEVLAEIHIRINVLADHPALGRTGSRSGTRFISIQHHGQTHRATYRVRDQQVIILRVRDPRQQGG